MTMSMGWLFIVSVLAGSIGALSGMGGGVVLIPVLTSCGIDIKRAIAISAISVIAISSSAASNYVKGHLANLKVSTFLEMFAVVGALVGASLAVIAQPRLLYGLCGVVLLLSCVVLWTQRNDEWHPLGHQDAFSRWLRLSGSYYDHAQRQTITYDGSRAGLGGILMFATGLVAGLLGIGGSALTVLTQHLVMGLPPKVAVTTSNLIIGSMALAGASVYLEARLIEVQLAAPVILGVFLGAFAGSKMLVGVTNRFVRIIFLCVVMSLGVEMLLHAWRSF